MGHGFGIGAAGVGAFFVEGIHMLACEGVVGVTQVRLNKLIEASCDDLTITMLISDVHAARMQRVSWRLDSLSSTSAVLAGTKSSW
jgi:hypothetical protein